MLRFENIPPQSPEEVNFTEAGIAKLNYMVRSSSLDPIIIGEALGSIILDNSGEDPSTPDFELAENIVTHLDEQAVQQVEGYRMNGITIPMMRHIRRAKNSVGASNV